MQKTTAPSWATQADPTPDPGDPYREGPTVTNGRTTIALAWDGHNATIAVDHARIETQLSIIHEWIGGMSVQDALFVADAIHELANVATRSRGA